MRTKVSTTLKWVFRGVVLLIVQLIAWILIDGFVPGFSIENFPAAIRLIFTLWVLNLLFWPLISRLTLKISVFTFGIFNLILVAWFIRFASSIVGGVTVESLSAAIWAAFVLAVINIVSSTFITIANTGTFYKEALKRRVSPKKVKDYPGIIFLEIDGLAYDVLQRAIKKGFAPNIKKLLDKDYRIEKWETDWSCQTGASQLGILHGNNKNIPAFRWFDKKVKKLVSSSSTSDTPVIEKIHSNGQGLLSDSGGARANMYSGDAKDTIFTSSTLSEFKKAYTESYYGFFSDPYNITRTFIYFVWEIFVEVREQIRQKVLNVKPSLGFKKRFSTYMFVRGFTNVIIKDVSVYALINDIFAGKKDAIYLTFFGYDELAHHSGVEDIDTLKHLRVLDEEIANLMSIAKEAKRKYNFVILSDHGQSNGATFKQRYGITLEDLVNQNTGDIGVVESKLSSMEDTSAVANFSKQVALGSHKLTSVFEKVSGKFFNYHKKLEEKDESSNITVLASGNLGLVYFTDASKRLTLSEINKKYPGLVEKIVKHKGVGFVVVDTKNGGVVIGKQGKVYLKSGRIVGKDPLNGFGKNALQHIKRSSSFTNAPDIFVNSAYYKNSNQIAAFEELIGSHGGLGGEQSFPFVMFPDSFEFPKAPIIGAEKLHKVLKSWALGK